MSQKKKDSALELLKTRDYEIKMFEALTAAMMNIQAFRDMMTCIEW